MCWDYNGLVGYSIEEMVGLSEGLFTPLTLTVTYPNPNPNPNRDTNPNPNPNPNLP